jgi:hypothetical protein
MMRPNDFRKSVRPSVRGGRAKARLVRTCAAILLLASAPLAIAPAPAAAQRTGALGAEIDALSAEVSRLEAARAIRNLQRAFGFYVDRGLWDEAADLFADNGSVEIGMDGVYVGKARIREYLKRLHGQDGLRYGQLNEWVTLQPLITVAPDGRTAKGRWRDLGMLGDFGHMAYWRDGTYENDYVLDDGVWKIGALHLYVNFVAPYEGGWARMQQASKDWRSDTAKAFPPDRPPSRSYRPFPEPQLPPFHFAHPVTGKMVTRDLP